MPQKYPEQQLINLLMPIIDQRIRDGMWHFQQGDSSLPSVSQTPFIKLMDTPQDYVGDALKVVRVNSTETALEFAALAAGGVTTFTALTDTPSSYASQALKLVRVNAAATALEFFTLSASSTSFIALTDTPSSYSAQALKLVRVNSVEGGLEFVSPPPAGITAFTGLSDTPNSYASQALKVVRVNAAATALEFVAPGGVISDFLGLTDTPNSYGGQAGEAVVVNATETGLDFSNNSFVKIPGDTMTGQLNVFPTGSGLTVPLRIKGPIGQSANLMHWLDNNTSAVMSCVTLDGSFGIRSDHAYGWLQVGNGTVLPGGTGVPSIVINRSLTATEDNTGFTDLTLVSGLNIIYRTFDADVGFTGANAMDTYMAFRNSPNYSATGVLTRLYSFVSSVTINSGTITQIYHNYVGDPTGAGALTNQYGLYINTLSKASNANWAVFTNGNTWSYFGGNVLVGQVGTSPDFTVGNSAANGTDSSIIMMGKSAGGVVLTATWNLTNVGTLNLSTQVFANVLSLNTTTGNFTFSKNVTVSGTTTFNGATTLSSLTVTGTSTFTGATSLNAVTFGGTISGAVIFGNNVSVGGTLSVTGNTTINGSLIANAGIAMPSGGDITGVAGLTMVDGFGFTFGTGSGTKIGTSSTQKIGFWNAGPIARPTVIGSRAGNAALTSLLTQLANMGLIVNTTTA